jgi:hypothetical protein
VVPQRLKRPLCHCASPRSASKLTGTALQQHERGIHIIRRGQRPGKARLDPSDAVESLTEQACMPVVASVFLDHVLVDPPQPRRLAGTGNEVVQAAPGHGRPWPLDARPVVARSWSARCGSGSSLSALGLPFVQKVYSVRPRDPGHRPGVITGATGPSRARLWE